MLSATLGLVSAAENVVILRDALIVLITPVGHAVVGFKNFHRWIAIFKLHVV